jgi:hypothetical protein
MEMQMQYFLARVFAGVGDQAKTRFSDTLLVGDLIRDVKHLGPQRSIIASNITCARDMTAWDHLDVHLCPWRDVVKGDDVVGLGNELGAKGTCGDLAKYAIIMAIRHAMILLDTISMCASPSCHHPTQYRDQVCQSYQK